MSPCKSFGHLSVVAIGEVLWDVYEHKRHLGGAPFNFIYTCYSLGARASLISRVGNDEAGAEIVRLMSEHGMVTDLIQIDDERPTGTVQVRLDRAGVPTFTIAENVAWDHIELPAEAIEAVRQADIVCFGTLAQRTPMSARTITKALNRTKPGALRLLDLNLRQNFYTESLVRDSLSEAGILKLDESEMKTLCAMFGLEGSSESCALWLLDQFALDIVVLTMGARGASAWRGREFAHVDGLRVAVHDTVGCGDAFAAAFALNLASGASLADALRAANIVGGYLALCDGATPALSPEILTEFEAAVGA
ncbi:MAG: carbohydrate kinase [Candidatus Sumerlaeaceae bacterium]|nr:carbohydrate kinase [Candidatus Sumerlaeaceae bacterium]